MPDHAASVAVGAAVHSADAAGTGGYHQLVQSLDVSQTGPEHLIAAGHDGHVEAAVAVV